MEIVVFEEEEVEMLVFVLEFLIDLAWIELEVEGQEEGSLLVFVK